MLLLDVQELTGICCSYALVSPAHVVCNCIRDNLHNDMRIAPHLHRPTDLHTRGSAGRDHFGKFLTVASIRDEVVRNGLQLA